LGLGGGGYDKLSPIYVPRAVKEAGGQERTVHNTYLWIATDWGLQGLVVFFGLVGATIISLHKIRRRTADQRIMLESFALEVGFWAFLGAAFFVNRTYSEMLYWIPALTAILSNIQARVWAEEEAPAGATASSGPQAPVMLGGHVSSAAARVREAGSGYPLAGNM
jgi:O-antigen ligase